MVQVDLRTAIIPNDTRVWRLFPGENYKFLNSFREANVAFLDIPGFEMPEGPLKTDMGLKDRLRRSEVMIDKIRRSNRDHVPRITQQDLDNFRVGKRRQRNQQALINFFEEAAPGDLVIAPDTLFSGQVLIGQFPRRRTPTVEVNVPHLYGPVPIPARRIHWFGSYAENTLSTTLSKALRNENAFTLIERSLFLEVFSLAFGSFVFGDHYSASIYNTKEDYLDRDGTLLSVVANMAAIMCERAAKDVAGGVTAIDSILGQASIDYHCSVTADVHSPGFNRFTSGKPTPLIISACIAALLFLSGCNSQAEVDQARKQIEFVNSGAPDDACTAQVSKASDLLLKSMDIDTVWKLCQNMKDAERRAGLKPSAQVKK